MNFLCSFDGISLKLLEDRTNTPYFVCPSCHEEYSRYEIKRLDQVKAERIESAQEELARLNKRKCQLTKFLTLAQSSPKCTQRQTFGSGLPGGYHPFDQDAE